jgi:hypothetical protein
VEPPTSSLILGFRDAAERQTKLRLAYALNQILTARQPSPIAAAEVLGTVSSAFLKARIDRFALQGQDAENTLVHASERLLLNEPFEPFDAQRELSQSQRSLA